MIRKAWQATVAAANSNRKNPKAQLSLPPRSPMVSSDLRNCAVLAKSPQTATSSTPIDVAYCYCNRPTSLPTFRAEHAHLKVRFSDRDILCSMNSSVEWRVAASCTPESRASRHAPPVTGNKYFVSFLFETCSCYNSSDSMQFSAACLPLRIARVENSLLQAVPAVLKSASRSTCRHSI